METPEKREYKTENIEDIKERLAQEFSVEQIESVEGKPEIIETEVDRIEEERKVRERLEIEMESIKRSPKVDDDVQQKAQNIKDFNAEGKLRSLLELVQSKSVPFAVATAQAMDDAYILDVFHDLLAKGGFYKDFIKES